MAKKVRLTGKSSVFILLVLVAVVCVVMYYYNLPPFDFDLGFGFKYIARQPEPTELVEGILEVHYIDVGQGDSILVRLPDGKNMLIDGGDKKTDTAETILTYLDGVDVAVLDYVVLTHTDADHCGSLDDVVSSDEVLVKTVYMPYVRSKYTNDPISLGNVTVDSRLSALGVTGFADDGDNFYIDTVAYADFVESIVVEGADILYSLSGTVIQGEGYTFSFITPTADMYPDVKKGRSEGINNVSPIILLEFNGIKTLFTGDAHIEAEEVFLDVIDGKASGYSAFVGMDVDVDVLKVGHHGSDTSTSNAFLDRVNPEYAVISAGEGNSYHHPHSVTIDKLTAASVTTYVTIDSGTIVMTVDAQGNLNFSTEK